MSNATIARRTAQALKGVGDWTEAEVEDFMANKAEFATLMETPEFQAKLRAHRYLNPPRQLGVDSHITHASGRRKTVCTSTVLGAFGIPVESYHYSAHEDLCAGILRRNGWHVRSRKSAYGIRKGITLAKLRKLTRLRAEGHRLMVCVSKHMLLLDENGKTLVDTGGTSERAKIENVQAVFRG